MEDAFGPAFAAGSAPALPGESDSAREAWEQDLLGIVLDLSRRGEDVVSFAMAGQPMLFLNTAAGAQHVLVEERHRYASLPFHLQSLSRSLTDDGAALIRLRHRENTRPGESSPAEIVEKTAAGLIARLADSVRARPDAPHDLLPSFKAALLGAMTEVLFGVSLPAETVAAAARAKALLERYTAYQLPPPRIAPGSVDAQRLQSAFETAQAYAREILVRTELLPAAELERPFPQFDAPPSPSPADQAVATVSRLLMNGYNGPSIALGWLAWVLAREQAVQAQVADEAARVLDPDHPSFDSTGGLPYTRAAVQEVLRMYPPAWLISRQALVEDQIGGTAVAAGSLVVISPYTLHRHTRYWDEPETFAPSRFEPGAILQPTAGSYLPFGLGATTCPAGGFALRLLPYLGARIAQKFVIKPEPSASIRPWGLISLHPFPGALVRLQLRGEGSHV